MRLSEHQRQTIERTARDLFGECTVYLFGSRVDDFARGGDIDLLVETPHRIENRAAMAARFAARLQTLLGDQRIDVLILDPATRHQPVHDRARQQGVALWH
ncbi:MAG: nucleotidyltransferase domain-containing protein [Thioalkalivibrio sp.]|nr:nucleotidyltransferase domain-containing protein [Thioalkalivibrio sp.]